MNNGAFKENTLRQNIEEEIELIQGLELEDTILFGLHTSNVIPVYGVLSQDKEEMINILKNGLKSIKQEHLDSHIERGIEGAISISRN